LGTYALSSGYYDAYYGRAQRVRTKIAEDFRRVFEAVEFVVTPTSPTVAFKLGERTADPLSMYYSDYCTVPMSLAGIPALSMPCGCELSFGEEPNMHTCAVCLGLPGSLPVVNERAVHFGLMIGLALGAHLAERSIFHRKNYFYPDLPKGYQISQYDEPLCSGG